MVPRRGGAAVTVYGPRYTRNLTWLVVLVPGVSRRFDDIAACERFVRVVGMMGGGDAV